MKATQDKKPKTLPVTYSQDPESRGKHLEVLKAVRAILAEARRG